MSQSKSEQGTERYSISHRAPETCVNKSLAYNPQRPRTSVTDRSEEGCEQERRREEVRGGERTEEGKDKWRWRAGALGRAASSRAF